METNCAMYRVTISLEEECFPPFLNNWAQVNVDKNKFFHSHLISRVTTHAYICVGNEEIYLFTITLYTVFASFCNEVFSERHINFLQ